jgi:hypothetical protein
MKQRVAFHIFQLAARLNDTDYYTLHCCNWAQIRANVSPERNMQERFRSTLVKKTLCSSLLARLTNKKPLRPTIKPI